ncbi:uncharacterized protein KY384_006803, partial [Bacidia gigantensis]|uniref:uncharacterized protein n=1 Tax=Bacidia gigantensis TaxID=2732470 RepID=UPI001D04BE9A
MTTLMINAFGESIPATDCFIDLGSGHGPLSAVGVKTPRRPRSRRYIIPGRSWGRRTEVTMTTLMINAFGESPVETLYSLDLDSGHGSLSVLLIRVDVPSGRDDVLRGRNDVLREKNDVLREKNDVLRGRVHVVTKKIDGLVSRNAIYDSDRRENAGIRVVESKGIGSPDLVSLDDVLQK